MYKDTKHKCEDFILDSKEEEGMGILKWVPCINGNRYISFYKCKKYFGLMCPYHWKTMYNR
jgi:hypothetical protein